MDCRDHDSGNSRTLTTLQNRRTIRIEIIDIKVAMGIN
jgi:hypothetical protein